MSFDGVFLHKLLPELRQLESGRISKITDYGDTDFILTIRVKSQNLHLMISMSSDFSRIHIANKQYDSPSQPKSLTMLLRKHIEGYFIEKIEQYSNDRIISFTLVGYNEMRDLTTKFLICEIMGRYSNLILTDKSYKIIESLKHDGVSEYGRTMLPNAIYQYPYSQKKNPFTIEEITASSPKELLNQVEGISMLFAQSCFAKDQVLQNIKNALNTELKPSILLNEKGKTDFYYTSFNYPVVKSFPTLSELLENYYYEADSKAKIKLKTNDLLNFVERQITKNQKKLDKLDMDMQESLKSEEFKIKGELLLSYSNLKEKEKQVEVFNYYTNQMEVIPLNIKYTILENSQLYYKKYQKSKTAIHYIEEQKKLAQNEIQYFQILSYQLQNCTMNDALEIQQELIDHHYLIRKETCPKKKKKPNYSTYIVDGVEISVGKNNIQNEYITHQLSKSNDMWFHVQNASGSHVVVHSSDLTENIIRTAANLAASFSSLSMSSSVPVDYTLIRNIKKIPGRKACFVSYTKQKTIYIDPDKNRIERITLKK